MPKVKISEWSSTPANNTDIDSINIAEGCAPSGINDAIRELMAQVKDWYAGTTGDTLAVAGGGTGAGTAANARVNLLPSYTSNGSKVLALNSGATDVEWVSSASGDVTLNGTQTLTNKTISGASNTLTVDGTDAVGFRNIPQNSQSAAYTCVLADSGKHIFHPSSDANARTFTIPANSSVAYPIGTAITFINMTAAVVTIAITTDTMYLSSAGTTGSRSLAQYGSATAIKMTSTTWLISGSGLT
jgi:hypothetical protein